MIMSRLSIYLIEASRAGSASKMFLLDAQCCQAGIRLAQLGLKKLNNGVCPLFTKRQETASLICGRPCARAPWNGTAWAIYPDLPTTSRCAYGCPLHKF